MQINRNKYAKRIKREAPGCCYESFEVTEDDFNKALPFVSDKVRVGVGGDSLEVLLINDEYPTTFKNLSDGETLEIAIVAVLSSDCANIIILR